VADVGPRAQRQPDPARLLRHRGGRLDRDVGRPDRPQRQAARTDFSNVHAAEKAVFGGRKVPFFGWHYPPFFLAIAFAVAALPHAWGLSVWLVASLAAYLAIMRAILPRPETLAVFVNIGHGLTAALLGGSLHGLRAPDRPARVQTAIRSF
jgi:hypothetical protein